MCRYILGFLFQSMGLIGKKNLYPICVPSCTIRDFFVPLNYKLSFYALLRVQYFENIIFACMLELLFFKL